MLFLDKSDAIQNHVFLLLISIVVVVLMTPVLIFICRLENPLLKGALTLGFQLLLGAFLSRFFYSSGIRAKQSIEFIDPSNLGKDWKVNAETVSIGDVRNFFEKLELVVEGASRSMEDDITDIAWFAVAVWSLGSTLSLLVFEIALVCKIGAFVILGIALISYYTGYASAKITLSSDVVHQIEYLVTSHLEFLNAKCPDSTSYAIMWKEKRRQRAPWYFIAETELSREIILILKLSVQYPIGEAIVIKAPNKFDSVLRKIENLAGKAENWKLNPNRRDGEIILERDMEEFKMAESSSNLFVDIDNSPTRIMLNSILLDVSTA
jgi:hypothetical protein